MSDDRQALIDAMARALCAWVFDGDLIFDRLTESERDDCRNAATATLDALLAVPVPLLREIAAATKPCETCGQFAGSIHEGQMPGHVYGSNWDWVPCQTCHGSGRVPAVDRAALLAALGMVRTNGVCTKCGWSGEVTDDPMTWLHDGCNYAAIQIKESWAARVSEETP